ncbi:hypothetical protein KS4_20830 [Poriferisphaera corsica]|uniref:Uncharacterized protein n=1 Tax=Poriferisphaera corsica TaxID=2528020 RepID=A0A517YV49_9BACT|nr:hypothetical protein KS4_20830 [Poriferisphaera corsica]
MAAKPGSGVTICFCENHLNDSTVHVDVHICWLLMKVCVV